MMCVGLCMQGVTWLHLITMSCDMQVLNKIQETSLQNYSAHFHQLAISKQLLSTCYVQGPVPVQRYRNKTQSPLSEWSGSLWRTTKNRRWWYKIMDIMTDSTGCSGSITQRGALNECGESRGGVSQDVNYRSQARGGIRQAERRPGFETEVKTKAQEHGTLLGLDVAWCGK